MENYSVVAGMLGSKPRYISQDGGTKINYEVSQSCTNIQVTISDRITGVVTIRTRPFFGAHPVLADKDITTWSNDEFETPPDNVITLAPSNGRVTRTFRLSGQRISGIQVDDAGTGAFGVNITQWD